MRKIGRKIFSALVFAAIIAFAALSVVREAAFSDRTRYIFVFESIDGEKLVYETRFLRKIEGMSDEALFCDELVLDSRFHDAKPIFPHGTKIESLFVRDGILYVDFSEELVKNATIDDDFAKIADIFAKNVATNFPSTRDFRLFCKGRQIKFDYKPPNPSAQTRFSGFLRKKSTK